MILSDREIQWYLHEKLLKIDPIPEEEQLQPASIDLRLGPYVTRFAGRGSAGPTPINTVIDTRHTGVAKLMEVQKGDSFEIGSGDFALAHTRERVAIPSDLVAVVDGRSSLGRLGLMVHVTAGYIDPGFEGQITLELHNVGPLPIRIYVGDRICQIRFHKLSSPAMNPYTGKYQGDSGAVPSRLHLDGKS